MQMIVDASLMKSIDNRTINEIGIPSMVLMERAALSVAEHVKCHVDIRARILAVCGSGNNGADAIAAARILKLQGYHADVLILSDIDKCSNESKEQINIAKNLGISIYNNINLNEYTIIIDGIFGIGLNKPVKGEYLHYIKLINQGNHTVFSVDIPSGLSSNTGKPLNEAIKADYTITFGFNKIGLILYPGCEYAGKVHVADIGFPRLDRKKEAINFYTYDKTDLLMLPKRNNDSHKGDYGKVLIIAGSIGMNGACFLASLAAYRIGAGLVKVIVAQENRSIMQTMLPEAIISTYKQGEELEKADIEEILDNLSWATTIAIGPGMGTSKISEEIFDLVLNNSKVPIIIDADGINILANKINRIENNNKEKINRIQELAKILPPHTVLTPHLKELSRLIGIDLSKIQENIIEIADICTHDNDIIFVMKDARTIVAHKNNRFINTSGNIELSQGAGAHRLKLKSSVNKDDEISIKASTRECLKNGSPTEKEGFFQYTAAGDSKHTVTLEDGKSARVLFEFQEMQEGSERL